MGIISNRFAETCVLRDYPYCNANRVSQKRLILHTMQLMQSYNILQWSIWIVVPLKQTDILNSGTFSPFAHPILSHNCPMINFRHKTNKTNKIKPITLQHLPFHWLVMLFLKQKFEHLFLFSFSILLTTGMPKKWYVISFMI